MKDTVIAVSFFVILNPIITLVAIHYIVTMKFSLSLLLSTLLSSVTAMPTPGEAASTVVEVIPGPGLPSLESLGITSADLFNKNFMIKM